MADRGRGGGEGLRERGSNVSPVRFVAERGYALLPQYTFDAATGEWRHLRERRPKRAWLSDLDYSEGAMRSKRAAGGGAAGGGRGGGGGGGGDEGYAAP